MKEVCLQPTHRLPSFCSSFFCQLLVSEHLMSELVAPVTYKNPVARLYCLLALKNLAYWAESPLKRLLMENLTWEHLVLYVASISNLELSG